MEHANIENLSKSELHDIITEQLMQLSRYKTRLKDVVAAHKSLLKEKELLEASLKSVRQTSTSLSCTYNDKAVDEREVSKDDGLNEPVDLRNQLSTLMNSLATLSEEKSRMEASFQNDKKILRQEKLQADNRIKDLEQRLEHETRSHLSEMENFKSKLIVERHQREKEHNDHGVMIRELQKVLSEERGRREKSEAHLENMNAELLTAQKIMLQSKKEATEAKTQLELLREKLKDNKQASGATADKLQQQLEQLKLHHLQLSLEEQEKIKEAEEKSRRLAAVHEERVANLEARLAELSLTVGQYDRLRQNDQLAIDRLKERLIQLEMEHGEEKSDVSADDLKNALHNLKKIIEIANTSSEKPIDVKGILREIIGDNSTSDDVHKLCQEEYYQVKKDLEFYKQQFNFSQISSTPSYHVENTKSLEYKEQIKNLKERISNLNIQLDGMEKLLKKEREDHQQMLLVEKKTCKNKMQGIESEWRKKVQSLENQLTKQRERALSLVNEKEQIISDLRESLNSLIPNRISSDKTNSENDGLILHYSEELARRDVELSRLRKDKLQTESDLREARRQLAQQTLNEQRLSNLLDHQLQRFEQCQTREGASLEYLKNVVFSFLLSTDSSSKCHMLNAIAAVLKFTEAEKYKITQHSWWYKPQN